jgi:hypothetical protein
MPDTKDFLDRFAEPQGIDPKPDPWAPPDAQTAQAASIGTGATGAALLLGDTPSSDTADGIIALLPDPTQLFGRVAHVLGFQFDASSAWTWGLILVVLSVVLNIISYSLRYRYAQGVERAWAAREAERQKSAQQLARDATAPQSKARGFVGGDA